jgi:hypothetical protein
MYGCISHQAAQSTTPIYTSFYQAIYCKYTHLNLMSTLLTTTPP